MRENVPAPEQFSETTSGIQELEIYKCYKESRYLSIKHSSYFQTYDELLDKYRGKDVIFVEVGVANGGSLFMWRSYLGRRARIIGIDLNPGAKKWEKEGFEIHVGSQADPQFWDAFFSFVGDVDVILDDGGHTNEQQIITANKTIPHIKDGGMLIVEDTHTSYFRDFGNPSKYSFISYAKTLVDSVNSRCPWVNASANNLNESILSITFYESIVCFKINRAKCFVSSLTSNDGISSNAEDFRDHGSGLSYISEVRSSLGRNFGWIKRMRFARRTTDWFLGTLAFISSRIASMKLRKYFA
jgi:Methyltransferase domain